MDSSKLGSRSPSEGCLLELKERFAKGVHIAIDACQMRLSRARLSWYLGQGFMVLISGSKFFTGPPFSGALLVPGCMAEQAKPVRALPMGLRDYTCRSAWPKSWRALRSRMPRSVNYGQYFRWIAAIEEMQAYFVVPPSFRRAALIDFEAAAGRLIADRSSDLFLLPGSDESLENTAIDNEEMSARTIFPFLIAHDGEQISLDESKAIHSDLNADISARLPRRHSTWEEEIASRPCHIGQPVAMACSDGTKTGALRLCASARMVSEAWRHSAGGLRPTSMAQEIRRMGMVLDKLALIRYLSAAKSKAA